MAISRPYQRHGDKKNSNFFEEYLLQLYDWRDKKGLTNAIKEMHSIVVEVDEQDRHQYINELMLMTPYYFVKSYENDQFIYSLLEISDDTPAFIIRSRKDNICSPIMSMNNLSPISMKKPHTRYIGEVFRVEDATFVKETLEQVGVNFSQKDMVSDEVIQFYSTHPSCYTNNSVAYISYSNGSRHYYLERFKTHREDEAWVEQTREIKAKQKNLGLAHLIKPIDHLATRILHQDREHAILELMKLTSYHYWGSYDIADQNSSTNVTRNSQGFSEFKSPAKVFTAANTPHYLDFLVNLPSPTESFVKNYGKRMHHIAYSVTDNSPGQDFDNVDFIVDVLKNNGIEFLLKVIGSQEEGLKQIFSRTSRFSLLITEYVQRFNGFEGFFTKENVAFLTKAAGEDGELKKEKCRLGERDLCD